MKKINFKDRVEKSTKGIKRFFSKISNRLQKELHDKTTGFKLVEVLIIVVVVTMTGVASGFYITYSYYSDYDNEETTVYTNDDLKEIKSVYQSLLDKYYDSVDKEELIEAAIKGMVDSLGDPYSSYMDFEEEQSFNDYMSGEYYGIGVELITDSEGNVKAYNIFPGKPAAKAGMKAGDIIVGLDKTNARGMSGADIAAYIKDLTSVSVDVTVERDGKEIVLNITKEIIDLPTVESEVYEKNDKKIGYIDVSLFANNTYDQFREAVLDLEKQNIDSLVIDVRDNSGGYLNVVVNMISMFLPKDSVIYQLQNSKETVKKYDLTSEHRTYPVAVLINKQSASASEILAAAFKEVYDSEIIGVTSYGKGTVQETREVEGAGMIKFTTQLWLSPDGNSINKNGIEPTINIPIDGKYLTNPNFDNDNQLQKAIEELAK